MGCSFVFAEESFSSVGYPHESVLLQTDKSAAYSESSQVSFSTET